MLEQRAVQLARELVRIKSITFQEREAAEYLTWHLKALGFETELDESNNVVALLRGSGGGKRLMFLGHHDTVEAGDASLWKHPPFEAVMEDGLLYGRGSNDEKGGIASCIAAMELFLRREGANLRGDILFVSSREETADFATRGIMKVIERGIHADCCICLEPSQMNIVLGHRGRAVIDLVTYGKTAHASVPAKGINAVLHMAHLVTAIEQMPLPYAAPLGWCTQCISTIQGGIRPNIVPERCEASVDRRIVTGETLDSVAAEFQAVIQRVKRDIPQLQAEFSIRPPFYPCYIPADSELVLAAKDAAKVVGYQPEITYFKGHTDAEWIINDLHIPTIILGPGNIDTAHSAHEVVEIAQLGLAAQMYYEMMRSQLL